MNVFNTVNNATVSVLAIVKGKTFGCNISVPREDVLQAAYVESGSDRFLL